VTEVADIFRQHAAAYQHKYGDRILLSHKKAIRAILQCRTEALGGHVFTCSACAQVQYRYHSCRNRHCPKCQSGRGQEWLETQRDFLLGVPYFLLTFTLPQELRKVARSNQKAIYSLLFRAAAQATQRLAQDPRFVGGQLGMIGVLHTWGRNLSYHPHVHYLVPAGGLAPEGWRPARRKFLLPVKALSNIYRAKFRDGLRKCDLFNEVPEQVWQQKWVVHCKPVGDGLGALKYLAPYIFRVAISNRRIVRLEDGQVTFRYKDTASGKTRHCQLSAEAFIRRFLQHVLPKGFVKVRYYGLFSPGKRQALARVRAQLESPPKGQVPEAMAAEEPDREEASAQSCPQCAACGQEMALSCWIRSNAGRRDPPRSPPNEITAAIDEPLRPRVLARTAL